MSSAEDQSRSEDDEQHEDRPQKTQLKAKFQSQNFCLRMTWKQKALAVQYYDETIPKPSMNNWLNGAKLSSSFINHLTNLLYLPG